MPTGRPRSYIRTGAWRSSPQQQSRFLSLPPRARPPARNCQILRWCGPAGKAALAMQEDQRMAFPVENVRLRLQALAYVIKLYDELTAENGAPTLGTQNQAGDVLANPPELRRAVA